MIKVALVEDDAFYRNHIQNFLDNSDMFDCHFAVDTGEKFLKYIGDGEGVDIILIDIGLPDISGLDIIKTLHNNDIQTEIAVLTIFEDSNSIFQALCRGANHYIIKGDDVDTIDKKLEAIYKGDTVMSPGVARKVVSYFNPKRKKSITRDKTLNSRELQVLKFIVDGLSYKLIAANLGITINGVRYYIKNIYKKLQVSSKAEAMKKYRDFII